MAEDERDSTSEWVLPAQARPATVAQLEQRIDHALAVAQASEAAALEIGAAALDAAEQARRAAELAERASAAMTAPREPAASDEPMDEAPSARVAETGEEAAVAESAYDSFRHFLERADRISTRLEAIAPAER